MTDAGRRERRGEVAIDVVAQADENPGSQPGFGLGQGPGQGLARGPPNSLDSAGRRAVRPEPLERAGTERGGDADPSQVRPVAAVIGRERLEPSADRHPIARGDARVGR